MLKLVEEKKSQITSIIKRKISEKQKYLLFKELDI
jgi:hypothetical protein